MNNEEMILAFSKLLDEKLDKKLDEKLAPINERFDRIETRLSALEEKVSGLDVKVSALEEKVSGLDVKVSRLEAGQKEIRKDIATLSDNLVEELPNIVTAVSDEMERREASLYEAIEENREAINFITRPLSLRSIRK